MSKWGLFQTILLVFLSTFWYETQITKPRERIWDQDQYRGQNKNGTGTGTNHRDQKWPGLGPGLVPVPVDDGVLHDDRNKQKYLCQNSSNLMTFTYNFDERAYEIYWEVTLFFTEKWPEFHTGKWDEGETDPYHCIVAVVLVRWGFCTDTTLAHWRGQCYCSY